MQFRHIFGQVFPLEWIIAAVVLGLVLASMVVAMLVSRRKKRLGLPASRREHWHRLEAAYGLALAGMVAFLVVTSFSANNAEGRDPAPALRVQVTAFQWCWSFHYAGTPVTVIAACRGGQYPTLVLPAGRVVEIEVTSRDVLHAFWVPHLRYKTDAFPGHVNRFTVTLDRDGTWPGRCAQLCGLDHSTMDFSLQAVPPAQFGRWLRAREGATAGAGT